MRWNYYALLELPLTSLTTTSFFNYPLPLLTTIPSLNYAPSLNYISLPPLITIFSLNYYSPINCHFLPLTTISSFNHNSLP